MPQSPLDVLIVDDNGLFREALEAILEAEHDVIVVGRARDGEEAVRLASELGPDVVLMDLSMPVMDGFEATAEIVKQIPPPTVVVLTGSDDDDDRARAREAGAAAYVTKDRIATELSEALRSATRRVG